MFSTHLKLSTLIFILFLAGKLHVYAQQQLPQPQQSQQLPNELTTANSELTSSQEDEEKEIEEETFWPDKKYGHLLNSKSQVFKPSFFQNILHDYSVEKLLESYYRFSIYQLPAMGDYSYPDNYLFSLMGNSWQWNKYYYNGFNMNDVFFPGRSLHKRPAFSQSLEIDSIDSTLEFNSEKKNKMIYAKGNIGYMGTYIPNHKILSDPYSQQHPQNRERPAPDDDRRRNVFNFDLYYRDLVVLDNMVIWLDAYNTIHTRKYLDFDYLGNHTVHNEAFFQTTISAEFIKPSGHNPFDFYFTYLTRDALYSEFYYHQQETANYSSYSFSGVYRPDWDKFKNLHGINFSYKNIERKDNNFSRNLFDVSGEGLYPFYPSIDSFEIAQHSQLSYSLDLYKPGFVNLLADFNNSLLIINPTVNQYENDIYFKSYSNTNSLYVTKWESGSSSTLLFDNHFSIDLNQDNGNGFGWDGKIGMDVDGFVAGNGENIISFSPHFELGLNILKMDRQPYRQNLRVEIGRKNMPYTSEFTTFLSDKYMNGKSYIWNDNNGNLKSDEGEVTDELHSTTGGAYRTIDPDFDQPHYYYMDIPYNIDFTSDWSFGIVTHYRIFKDQAWVRLANKDGSYSNIDGEEVYFPSHGEKRYQVYNLPASKFPSTGRNWFSDSPFYLGFSINFSAEGNWYYYYISFSAYLVNGITTLGNGPLHNSQGTLNELMADPNQDHKNIGRLDSDRGYTGNSGLTIFFLPQFTGTLSLKYRDGQPIGKWEYYLNNDNNVIFRRKNVSADNILLYNGEFGTREDALWTMDLSLKYQFTVYENPLDLIFNIYNIFDFGRELIEYSFYGTEPSDRNALELQVPRGLVLAVEYTY